MAGTDRRTGSVASRRGRVKAARINTGLTMEGAANSDTLRAATEALGRLRTGDVSAGRGIDSAGEINVGISYQAAAGTDAAEIGQRLLSVRQLLDTAAARGGPAEVGLAASLTDQIVASLGAGHQEQGQPKAERVRELVSVLSRAGMTVETASACASAVAAALNIALDILTIIH